MTGKRSRLHGPRPLAFVLLVVAMVLGACAPGMSPDQIQAQIKESVAQTVQAQNDMATVVAQTVEAMVPAPSATSQAVISPPTLTPIVIPTVTPWVIQSGSGGSGSGGSVPEYACSFIEVKPRYNTFKPTDYIDIVWIITNTGKKTWPSNLDLDFVSGTKFSPYTGQELPPLKSGERVTISFEGNAPSEPGFYEMKFKVQGGLCFPFIDIEVIKPPGSDP